MEFTDGQRHKHLGSIITSPDTICYAITSITAPLYLPVHDTNEQRPPDGFGSVQTGRRWSAWHQMSEETYHFVHKGLGFAGGKRRVIFWLQWSLDMTSGKSIRNLIWEGGIKTLDVRRLAVGLSRPLAELLATRKVAFQNMVRIINKLPQAHVIVLSGWWGSA